MSKFSSRSAAQTTRCPQFTQNLCNKIQGKPHNYQYRFDKHKGFGKSTLSIERVSLHKIRKMVGAFLKEWSIQYRLGALVRKGDFSKVNPERVLTMLNALSVNSNENSSSAVTLRSHEIGRLARLKKLQPTLIRIWELCNAQAKEHGPQGFKWRRAMAVCNSIYEQISEQQASEKPRVTQRAATAVE